MFGVERSGSREELCTRLVDYLAHPMVVKSGSKVQAKKRTKSASSSSKRTKTKRAKKEKVKRPPSAYLLFSAAHRDAVKAENPEASFTDMGKLLGELWRSQSDEVKAEWQAKADQEKKNLAEDSNAENEDEILADAEGSDEDAESGAEEADDHDSDDEEQKSDADYADAAADDE